MENYKASTDLTENREFKNDVRSKREKYFWMQALILALLLVVTGFTFLTYNNLEIAKGIKIIFAPFLSVVPLIFTLTIIREWGIKFKQKEYSVQQIRRYSVITVVTAGLFVLVTKLLSHITAAEILIAVVIAIASIMSFVSLKVRDILGISILTGIAEGIIIYMIFFF